MKKTILCGVSVGVAGGALLSYAGLATPVIGLLLGCVYGLIFCLLAGSRANTPGQGLLWGLAFALVFWLVGPASIGPLLVSASPGSTMMLDTVRARFPDLVGYIIFFGAPFLQPGNKHRRKLVVNYGANEEALLILLADILGRLGYTGVSYRVSSRRTRRNTLPVNIS